MAVSLYSQTDAELLDSVLGVEDELDRLSLELTRLEGFEANAPCDVSYDAIHSDIAITRQERDRLLVVLRELYHEMDYRTHPDPAPF